MAHCLCLLLLAASTTQARAARTATRAENAELHEPFTFDIVVDVKNKEEVVREMGGYWFGWAMDWVVSDEAFMEKLVGKFTTLLPEKLGEKGFDVDVVPKPTRGLVATMEMTVKGFDLFALLSEAKGERFARALTSLDGIFTALGKDDRWPAIEEKINSKVKAALMTKVPAVLEEQLQGQHVKAKVTTDPEPDEVEEEELPERIPEPPDNIFYSVVFEDREAIAAQARDAAGGGMMGRAAAAAVRKMSSKNFKDKVGAKLMEKIPASVEEQLAGKDMTGALAVSLAIAEMPDAGAEMDAFWVILTPQVSFDAIRDKNSKLDALIDTLGILHEEGVEAMGIQLHNMRVQIEGKVIDGVAGALPRKLEEMLNAKVERFNKTTFNTAKRMGTTGRCCGPLRGQSGTFFWVPADHLKRGTKCPYVHEDDLEACVYNKFVRPLVGPPEGVVQTHHRAVVECLEGTRDVSTICF